LPKINDWILLAFEPRGIFEIGALLLAAPFLAAAPRGPRHAVNRADRQNPQHCVRIPSRSPLWSPPCDSVPARAAQQHSRTVKRTSFFGDGGNIAARLESLA